MTDSESSKYRNRLFSLLGFLANKGIFEKLSHKEILEICLDESGDNQSNVKELRHHMGDGIPDFKLLAKMFFRMNNFNKEKLSKAMKDIID